MEHSHIEFFTAIWYFSIIDFFYFNHDNTDWAYNQKNFETNVWVA